MFYDRLLGTNLLIMSGFIDFAASKKCYAIMWSYGGICVGCNCCGRQEKGLKTWEARLNYHKEELERNLNFNQWAEGYPELIKTQKANAKINIAHEKAKIRQCKKAIKRLSLICA
jgi:hypothetical protein